MIFDCPSRSVPENALMSKYGVEFLKNPSLLTLQSADSQPPNYQFNENGYLFLASSPTGRQQLEINDRMYRGALDISWIQLLERNHLSVLFPWLNAQDILSGSFGTKNEGYFDPWSLLQALRTKARSLMMYAKKGHPPSSRVYVIAGTIDGCCLCGRYDRRS